MTEHRLSPRPATVAAVPRRLHRVGIQLYTLRDDAQRDLERTLGDIARTGYVDVELLGSMNNFGMSPERLRALLDREGLRAPSTHVGGEAFSYLERLGSRYWLFHIKDLPRLGASSDTELGKGVIDFRRLLASIDHIDDKFVF